MSFEQILKECWTGGVGYSPNLILKALRCSGAISPFYTVLIISVASIVVASVVHGLLFALFELGLDDFMEYAENSAVGKASRRFFCCACRPCIRLFRIMENLRYLRMPGLFPTEGATPSTNRVPTTANTNSNNFNEANKVNGNTPQTKPADNGDYPSYWLTYHPQEGIVEYENYLRVRRTQIAKEDVKGAPK